MTDISGTIAPKSDQMNADDLIAGPRTITVTKVLLCGEPDQPVAIHFEGDQGDTRTMRNALAVTCAANVGLDPLLMYGLGPIPALGVQGRFYTSGSLAGGQDKMLVVADFLIQASRKV